jgi:fibronectin type 3 domain-containing protein
MDFDPATGNLVLFGGTNGSTESGTTWAWNGSTWAKLAGATSPEPRTGATMAYDPATGQMVLFGGTATGDTRNTTWLGIAAPATVPGKPGKPTAVAGNATAKVTWTAPASNGGSTITAYTVTSTPTGKTCTTTGTLSCTVGGLKNGTAYSFSVKAKNGTGTSAASTPSTKVTPATVPGKPGKPTAVAGNATAKVTWTAPATDGGSVIKGYTVTSAPTGITCATTGTLSCTVGGLKNGTAYSFTVKATNAKGAGGASTASAKVTPATVPVKPGTPTAVAGTASAEVHWTAPATDGGSAVTSYTVTSSPTGKTCTTTAFGTLACTVGGLKNGTAYSFTVKATNAKGAGAASTASAKVTPATVPGTPGTPGTKAGNGAVQVTWTVPATDGGATITGYTVTTTPTSRTCTWTGSGPLACTVSGLTNGARYTFTVTATNWAGTGAASTPSAVAIPTTVPGTPGTPTAVAGDGSAEVTWTAPATDGGTAVTGYTVTSTPSGKTCTTTGGLSCTVGGLDNGTAYSFTVKAKNSTGPGPASTASARVTPATVPGTPGTPAAVAGRASATVTWSAPATDGGSTITGYTVTSTPTGKTCTVSAPTPTTTTFECTVTGLKNGRAYTFTVRARNAEGDGPVSTASAAVTPVTVPGAPGTPTVVAGNMAATVTFTASTTDGGSAITGYTVTSTPTGKTCTVTPTLAWTPTATTTFTCTVGGLKNGTAYTFTVAAENRAGPGSPSTPTATVTPATVPGKPGTPTALPGNASAEVSWHAPATDGGAVITSYKVTSAPTGKTCTVSAPTPTTTTFGCTVVGLKNGTTYTFTVAATNRKGAGPASSASTAVVPTTVPAKPGRPTAVSENTAARVSWSAPATDGGSAVTGYTVTSRPTAKTCATTGALTCTVTGLKNGTPYTFTVKAKNARGTGPASTASLSVTPATVASAPTGLSAARAPDAVSLTWTAPTTDGGSPVTGYRVLRGTSSGAESATPIGTSATTSYTDTSAVPGIAYFYEVVAVNAAGYSAASDEASSTTSVAGSYGTGMASAPTGRGYWLVSPTGGIFAYDGAQFYGSLPGVGVNVTDIVAMASTPDGRGYWLVGSDGGIFAFGDAHFYGSMGGQPLDQPIVGMASTPDGRGYWLVAGDGGMFAFGDAHFYGSLGGVTLNKPIEAMTPTPDGKGYWMVASDGGMFAFGDAHFYGSMGGQPLNQPIVAMSSTPDGRGYWLVAGDGGIFAFGDAAFYGTTAGGASPPAVVGLFPTPGGLGYTLVESSGTSAHF